MKIKQAAKKWEVTVSEAMRICKNMSVNPKNIPEDIIPVYSRDKRYTKNPHRNYVFILDVIANTHLELDGIADDVLETCVEQLRNAGLIVLKHGKSSESLNYHDYIISANQKCFYDWKNYKIKKRFELIAPIIQNIAEGCTAITVAAMKTA